MLLYISNTNNSHDSAFQNFKPLQAFYKASSALCFFPVRKLGESEACK